MKVRQNLYLDREVCDALDALAAGPGSPIKSHLANTAIREWLARRGSREVDDLLKVRLDRFSRELGFVRRDIQVISESLALFVRYELLLSAHLPEADAATRAIGLDRFEKFVAQVGRQLASGRPTLGRRDQDEQS